MVDVFCRSHFSFNEKKDLFFPVHPVICRTCRRPRIKRLIDLNDFSLHHQNLICMFGHPHAVVPAVTGGGGVPPAGGIPPAGAPHGGAPGPAPHGGPHINPLYVTRNEFNIFRNNVNKNMQQLQNQINQNTQQLQNQINQNMQQLQNQFNLIQGQMRRINQRLGI